MFNRVGIFWDYNACPTNDARESNTIRLLRKECINHGNIVLFKAYFGLPGIAPHKQPPASIRSEIEEAGVTTLNHPNAGFGAFATDVFCFLLDQDKSTTPTTVVLVSGNPNITYLVYALHARGVRVGLIAPSGQLNELSSQISWTKDWEDYTRITNISISHDDTIPPGVASTKSAKHHSNHGLIDSSCARGSNATCSPATQTKPDIKGAHQALLPSHATSPPPKIKYKVTKEEIPSPIQTGIRSPFLEEQIPTSSHKLHMFEDDPQYVHLVQDSEAVKVKTWRRKLKQLFFYQDTRKNPQVQSELNVLFTSLEKYDKMTKNYLAFTQIGKLLTQITQTYLNSFDYREAYIARAEELLKKWEPVARAS